MLVGCGAPVYEIRLGFSLAGHGHFFCVAAFLSHWPANADEPLGVSIGRPPLTVTSAGNSGPFTNTVGAPGSGYNRISVGALGNASAYDSVTSFSSWGVGCERGFAQHAAPCRRSFGSSGHRRGEGHTRWNEHLHRQHDGARGGTRRQWQHMAHCQCGRRHQPERRGPFSEHRLLRLFQYSDSGGEWHGGLERPGSPWRIPHLHSGQLKQPLPYCGRRGGSRTGPARRLGASSVCGRVVDFPEAPVWG